MPNSDLTDNLFARSNFSTRQARVSVPAFGLEPAAARPPIRRRGA